MIANINRGIPATIPAGEGPNSIFPPSFVKKIPIELKPFMAPCPIMAGTHEPVLSVAYERSVPVEKQKSIMARIPMTGYPGYSLP